MLNDTVSIRVGNYVKIQYHLLINGINSLIVSLMLDKLEICYSISPI